MQSYDSCVRLCLGSWFQDNAHSKEKAMYFLNEGCGLFAGLIWVRSMTLLYIGPIWIHSLLLKTENVIPNNFKRQLIKGLFFPLLSHPNACLREEKLTPTREIHRWRQPSSTPVAVPVGMVVGVHMSITHKEEEISKTKIKPRKLKDLNHKSKLRSI